MLWELALGAMDLLLGNMRTALGDIGDGIRGKYFSPCAIKLSLGDAKVIVM